MQIVAFKWSEINNFDPVLPPFALRFNALHVFDFFLRTYYMHFQYNFLETCVFVPLRKCDECGATA